MSLNEIIIDSEDNTSNQLEIIRKPKATDNLATIVKWIGREGNRINTDFKNFREHLEMLFTENLEFQEWIITNSQDFIAISCGITQGYVSRIFGPAKKEHRLKVITMINDKIADHVPKADIAEEFNCSVRTVQRAAMHRHIISSNTVSEPEPSFVEKRKTEKIVLLKLSKEKLVSMIFIERDLFRKTK